LRRLKKKDYENLSHENVQKVIALLNPDNGSKPITKKEACGILNIAYNTARLQRIIDDFEDKRSYIETRKSQNRGKAATSSEISEAITGYLRGESVAEIAKGLYRSSGFVKGILGRVGVPQHSRDSDSPLEVDYIPEECVSEEFAPGEIVWSAKHHTTALIEHEISVDYQAEKPGFNDVNYEEKYGSRCYSIWVVEDINDTGDMWANVEMGGYKAFSLAYDLGKLTHLEKFGVNLSRI
jgi:hypothetical protein